MAKTRQIEYVADLIRSLCPSEFKPGDLPAFTRVFSREGEGTLFLSQIESQQYYQTLQRLIEQFGSKEDLSPHAIEQELRNAVFTGIDIPKKRNSTSDERIQSALQSLLAALNRPSEEYECYLPIGGVDQTGLPLSLGPVTFVPFDEKQLRHVARWQQSPSKPKKREGNLLADLTAPTPLWQAICARTRTRAKDPESALGLALKRVRSSIDVVNFFAEFVPFNYGWIHLPEEAASVAVSSGVFRHGGHSTILGTRKGPGIPFSFEKLRQTTRLRGYLTKVRRLLSREPRSEFDQLVLSAMQWAGRGSVEHRRDEAFLLLCIALECLMLPEKETEIGYRLRVRTAHLLGRTYEERSYIDRTVGDLYKIRSKIVHTGRLEITQTDLDRIRGLAKRTILNVLDNRAMTNFQKAKDFSRWLNERVLR